MQSVHYILKPTIESETSTVGDLCRAKFIHFTLFCFNKLFKLLKPIYINISFIYF